MYDLVLESCAYGKEGSAMANFANNPQSINRILS